MNDKIFSMRDVVNRMTADYHPSYFSILLYLSEEIGEVATVLMRSQDPVFSFMGKDGISREEKLSILIDMTEMFSSEDQVQVLRLSEFYRWNLNVPGNKSKFLEKLQSELADIIVLLGVILLQRNKARPRIIIRNDLWDVKFAGWLALDLHESVDLNEVNVESCFKALKYNIYLLFWNYNKLDDIDANHEFQDAIMEILRLTESIALVYGININVALEEKFGGDLKEEGRSKE